MLKQLIQNATYIMKFESVFEQNIEKLARNSC